MHYSNSGSWKWEFCFKKSAEEGGKLDNGEMRKLFSWPYRGESGPKRSSKLGTSIDNHIESPVQYYTKHLERDRC